MFVFMTDRQKAAQAALCGKVKKMVKKSRLHMHDFHKMAGISITHWYEVKKGNRELTPEVKAKVDKFIKELNIAGELNIPA